MKKVYTLIQKHLVLLLENPVREPLQTGIKAIDALFPIGKGQRELVIVIGKLVKLLFVFY